MEIAFKIDQEKVAQEIIAGMNKTILEDTFRKTIERKAYSLVSDFDKSFGESIKWAMEKKVREVLDSDEFKPQIDAAIRTALEEKLPALGKEFLDKVSIRGY